MPDFIMLFSDPTVWAGLFTLVILEVVLGIDNLIFIAILADKLPPHQRDRARQLGLALALIMRLLLLASISWLMGLTETWFTILGNEISGRDVVLLLGGFFLIYKATREIHERLEGHSFSGEKTVHYADFWLVIAQIVVLDAVFSIDSVITAIGMSNHLEVMMIAVIIAIGIMLLASKPLTRFVNAHPTVVMLCLGFLLMVGFSLVADGVGFHIPKGYLYTAIAFSVLIELFNQITIYKVKKRYRGLTMRERTAEAVLRMLGKNAGTGEEAESASAEPIDAIVDAPGTDLNVFSEIEREMMRGVLKLGERSVKSIMTPRHDIVWLDINNAMDDIRQTIRDNGFSQYLVCDGDINKPMGIIKAKDIVAHPTYTSSQALQAHIHPLLALPDNVPVLNLLETFRHATVKCAAILDEYGSVEGLVTVTDILGAIAGEFGQGEEADLYYEPVHTETGAWIMDGEMDIHRVEDILGIRGLVDPENEYVTLAGFVLWQMKKIPHVGEFTDFESWRFTVLRMEGRKIADIEISQLV